MVDTTRSENPPPPDDNTTLLAVLHDLAAEGWTENLSVTDDGDVRCPQCEAVSVPAAVKLDRLRRLEGASDPADMMAVLAITCPGCSGRGVAVAGYGPNATPGDTFLLQAIDDQRPGT